MTESQLTHWRTAQLAASLSKRTVNERAATVRRFVAAMDVDPTIATIDQITEWLADDAWSPATRATYHANLQAWFGWLHATGRRLDNPMILLRAPKRQRTRPRPIPRAHVDRLLGQRLRFRTRMMILLGLLQGLRVHEIAKIHAQDVDIIGGTIRIIGKGGVDITLPLHPVVAALAPRMPAAGYWFPSPTKRGHVLGQSVSNTIAAAMRRVQCPGTPHALRHTFGTELHRRGTDVKIIQELMRHANLSATQIYVEADERAMTSALASLDLTTPTAM